MTESEPREILFSDDAWGLFTALPERAQREVAAFCDLLVADPTPPEADKWQGGVPDTYVWHGRAVTVWYRVVSPAEVDVVYLRMNT